MNNIPSELWVNILDYLTVKTREKLRLVSKYFNDIVESHWKFNALSLIHRDDQQTKNLTERRFADLQEWASCKGYLDVIKFVINTKGLCKISPHLTIYEAAYCGHLEIIKFLISNDIRYKPECICRHACDGNQFQIVKWVATKYNLHIKKDFFASARFHDNVEMAKFLLEIKRNETYPLDKFGFPSKFHRFRGEFIREQLILAVKQGQINFLKWVTGELIDKLNIKISRAFKFQILTSASHRGEAEAFRWITERYKLYDNLSNCDYNYRVIVGDICSSRSKDIVEYAVEKFKIEKENFLGDEN